MIIPNGVFSWFGCKKHFLIKNVMNGRYGRKNETAVKSWWDKSLIRLENFWGQKF